MKDNFKINTRYFTSLGERASNLIEESRKYPGKIDLVVFSVLVGYLMSDEMMAEQIKKAEYSLSQLREEVLEVSV